MKILEIDYDYYCYPEGMTCLKAFIEYANKNYNSFIALTQFKPDNCVFPYLIKKDAEPEYVNFANLNKIGEVDAAVLCRLDYEAYLLRVVEEKCADCVNYEEIPNGDNLKGHSVFGIRRKKDKQLILAGKRYALDLAFFVSHFYHWKIRVL